MKIINLFANPIHVIPKNARSVMFEPTERSAQVRMKVQDVTTNGVVKDGYWSHTRNLPRPTKDTLYIVSSNVAMFELYENGRSDLLFPWGLVRSEDGKVIGCRALCRPRTKHNKRTT